MFNKKEWSKQYRLINKEKLKSQNQEYYIKNRKRILERTSEYNSRNRDKASGYTRKYRNNNIEKALEQSRNKVLKDYGITIEEYNEILIKQGGRCAICGKHQSDFKHSLCVDHIHETGEIRGLLCKQCNLGLGNFVDSITLLYKAIKYLEKIREEGVGNGTNNTRG